MLIAASNGWLGTIDKLLDKGADINVTDNEVPARFRPFLRPGTRVLSLP
jgi:hypothetical protein